MRLTKFLLSKAGKYTKPPQPDLPKPGKYSTDYSNLPDRYIRRAMRQIEWENPKGIQYKPNTTVERRKFKFGVDRPWTGQFYEQNAPGRYTRKIFVEPIRHWSYFRGDRVEILVGPDAGKQGIVKQVVQERNWVLVDGLNCVLKKIGERKGFDGIWVQAEKPLLVTTQVALVDPSDLRATPIEWRYTEDGRHVRVSVRTGRVIPMPATAGATIDYKTRGTYKEQSKDTAVGDVSEITFEPKLQTFEMDVMGAMGIEEDRVPPKSYWY